MDSAIMCCNWKLMSSNIHVKNILREFISEEWSERHQYAVCSIHKSATTTDTTKLGSNVIWCTSSAHVQWRERARSARSRFGAHVYQLQIWTVCSFGSVDYQRSFLEGLVPVVHGTSQVQVHAAKCEEISRRIPPSLEDLCSCRSSTSSKNNIRTTYCSFKLETSMKFMAETPVKRMACMLSIQTPPLTVFTVTSY